MSPEVTTFLFEAANFLVLALVLGWFFFKPVRQAMEDRQSKLVAQERQAEQKLAEATQQQQQIEDIRGNLQREVADLRARELEAARARAQQYLDDAKVAADREMEATRRRAASFAESQLSRLSQTVAVASAETVRQLLVQIDGPEMQAAFVQSACEQLRRLPKGELAPVKVESARTLTDGERSTLLEAMGDACDSAKFCWTQELGCGVRISTASGLIDASALGLASFARQALLKEMNHGENPFHVEMNAGEDERRRDAIDD